MHGVHLTAAEFQDDLAQSPAWMREIDQAAQCSQAAARRSEARRIVLDLCIMCAISELPL
jgi:hypothetical protein